MRLCLGALLLLLSACTPVESDLPTTVLLDLVADFGQAEVRSETGFIDVGTPEARRFLADGWSWNEKGKDGKTFVWGTRQSSELIFYSQAPRDLSIAFRCLPFRRSEGSVKALDINLNGKFLGEIPLRKGWKEYTLEIPANALQAGINRMRFDYRWTTEAAAQPPEIEGRQVAVAWDWLRFPGARTTAPLADASRSLLVLPPASQVDFYFAATGRTDLVVESVEHGTEDGGRLEISATIEGEDEPSSVVFDNSSDLRPLRWPLTEVDGLVRLRLRSSGEFALSQPLVLTAPPEVPPEPSKSSVGQSVRPLDQPSLVLLYLIDTLRADHTSGYEYDRETTPGLRNWMRDAVVFEEAMASSSWTKPSVASLFTGHQPWTHGAEGDREVISHRLESLAQYFQVMGFTTGGFSTNGYVSAAFGFDRGFDHFVLMPDFDTLSDQVQGASLRWLAERDADERTFLYIQTIDPHAPYSPRQPYRSRFATGRPDTETGSTPFMRELAQGKRLHDARLLQDLIDLYDAEIAYNDQQFDRFLTTLKDRGLYEDAMIVVLSDHGEEFRDHGSWTHGRSLHREVLRVPFAIKFPDNWAAGIRIPDTVQLIDLLPTLLDYFNQPIPPELPGRSLLCPIQQAASDQSLGCEPSASRAIFSSVHYHHSHWASVILGDWKLVLRGPDRLDQQAQLFHRRLDPAELHDLADRHPIRVGYLAATIRRERLDKPFDERPEQVELDEETIERLQALGYLN